MEARKFLRYNEKIVKLRTTDPIIDWSDVKILVVGQRRVAHWMHSEVDSD